MKLHTTKWTRIVAVLVLGVTSISACSPGPANEAPTKQPTPVALAHVTQQPTSQPTAHPLESLEPASTEQATPQPAATAIPTATSTPVVPPAPITVAGMPGALEGLTIDEFFEASYNQLLLRNPEYLTALGLSRSFGLRNDRLNDLSEEYLSETQKLEAKILGLLHSYDREQLSPEQQVSYDVYEWYLDNRLRGHQFAYHNYPVHHFLGSYQDELLRLFTEIHPLKDVHDAEDYVERLSRVDAQVGQLLQGLKVREEMGVIPPSFIISMTLRDLRRLSQGEASTSPFFTSFRDRLKGMEGLSDTDRESLLERAEQQVSSSVVPAFRALADYVEGLQPLSTADAGAWKLPDGKDYYAYMLRTESSTDLTPEEVHELGLAEVERIEAQMQEVAAELGYPEGIGIGSLMNRVAGDGGFYETDSQAGKDRLIAAYEALLDEVGGRLDEVFEVRPQAQVVVVGDPGFGGGGYYVQGARDGSRPGAFHTGVGGSAVPKFNMPTIAYHEAIPGHHFQIAIAQEADLPTLRTDLFFNGYAEGWALYAERLAWELGLYEDDPYGDLGRLHLELLRAARLVADTGIHHMGWTLDETKQYLEETMGGWTHEAERYVVLPAQATGYKIGMLEFLELRQRAMEELGDQFDLKEFHDIILKNGSMPLEILEQVVDAWIGEG